MSDKKYEPGQTVVRHCSCHHPAQDAMHGDGMRVHNVTKDTAPQTARCTVCEQKRRV